MIDGRNMGEYGGREPPHRGGLRPHGPHLLLGTKFLVGLNRLNDAQFVTELLISYAFYA